MKSKNRISGNIAVVEMPFNESFQIDTWEDFRLVESLL